MRAGGTVQGRGWCRGLLAALAVSLLGACQDGSAARPVPPGPAIGFEVAEEPAPEPVASEPEDPWAVPDVLTEDYVRRVLTEIEAEAAPFLVWLVATEPGDHPPPDVAAHIHSTYTAVSSDRLIAEYVRLNVEREGDWSHLRSPLGSYKPDVLVLHRADPRCPLIEVQWDATNVEGPTTPYPRQRQVVTIGPQETGAPVNATGWVYTRVYDASEISVEDIDNELKSGSMCVD